MNRLVVPILVAALVLSAITALVFGILLVQDSEPSAADVTDFLDDERGRIDQRATEIVTLLLNYDATNIEDVADEMLSLSTGNFRQQYEELILGGAGGGLAEALEEAAASSRGQILDGPDVSFRSSSEAIAIARVTQTAQSSQTPAGRTIEYVLELTLVNTADGGWKADRIEVLSQRQTP